MSKVNVLIIFFLFQYVACNAADKPRVFIFTDINIDSGDPDDRQSLIHLFWYADELQIEGVVPDRWSAKGLEACQLVWDTYTEDYQAFSFDTKGYPEPQDLRNIIAKDKEQASQLFVSAASETSSPLYVLIWGNMELFSSILLENPALSKNIRLITIGTGLMAQKDIPHIPPSWEKSRPCEQLNWNGAGRNSLYNNPLFDDMWWLEMNWTYAGMFSGEEPTEMFKKLQAFGRMGQHVEEVVKSKAWAQYFRVGDTPSVLYVIDPQCNLDDPTQSSWAGRFVKPFPEKKSNYYTDDKGSVEWDYAQPCSTWQNHTEVQRVAKETLGDRRQEMYDALIKKLERIYKQ